MRSLINANISGFRLWIIPEPLVPRQEDRRLGERDWLSTKFKPIYIFINDRTTADDVFISPQLAPTSERVCNLWISTRAKIQRKLNSPSNHRYGLQFLLCILLAGDIATNPGPTNMNYSKARNPDPTTSAVHYLQSQNSNYHNRKPFAKCLVVNARSLLSFHKKDWKQLCNLSNV